MIDFLKLFFTFIYYKHYIQIVKKYLPSYTFHTYKNVR